MRTKKLQMADADPVLSKTLKYEGYKISNNDRESIEELPALDTSQ